MPSENIQWSTLEGILIHTNVKSSLIDRISLSRTTKKEVLHDRSISPHRRELIQKEIVISFKYKKKIKTKIKQTEGNKRF